MNKIYILDDEPRAIEAIQILLNQNYAILPHEIIGSHFNAQIGLEEINTLKPDLLFLDINLSECNGFQILESLTYSELLVIFVTAYRDFAVEAFNANAFHYLLKPLSPFSFTKTLHKVALHQKKYKEGEKTEVEFTPLKKTKPLSKNQNIALRNKEDYIVIPYTGIIWVEAEGAYTKFHLNKDKVLIQSRTLKFFLSVLNPTNFIRINRSAIINLEKIHSFSFRNGGLIKLSNGQELFVGKTYREEINSLLKRTFF